MAIIIKIDDLRGSEIAALLEEHLQNMYLIFPPEGVHALDIEALRKPEITFWSAWDGTVLCGCGALKQISPEYGEVKSMRTASLYRRKGIASALLTHIIDVSRQRGYKKLNLETGSMNEANPARTMYEKFGFSYCNPFEGYSEDPNSVFMVKYL
jgi:putative acetyltransferase